MASCQSIVDLALRKLGKLGAGRSARQTDATDALDALASLYGSWVASGAFGRLHDVTPIGAEYTALCGQRVTRQSASLTEVTLPDQSVRDPLYDYGRRHLGGTVPRDGSAVVIVSLDTAATETWIYDGTAKRWQEVSFLQLNDEAPRSTDRMGLAACLAIEMADQYGSEVQPATLQQAARYKMALTHRYGFEDERVGSREAYF